MAGRTAAKRKANGHDPGAAEPGLQLAGSDADAVLSLTVSDDSEPPGRAAASPQIERWTLDRLKPYARNSRTHSPEQVDKIVASIERFGFTNPILALPDGTIVAGHGRRLAAAKLQLDSVPVIVCAGWTEEETRLYIITDNKLALDAGWDEELLKLELTDLGELGLDVTLTGFSESDMNQLFGTIAEDTSPPAEQMLKPAFQILIECADEAEQLRLLEELQTRAINCRALIS